MFYQIIVLISFIFYTLTEWAAEKVFMEPSPFLFEIALLSINEPGN